MAKRVPHVGGAAAGGVSDNDDDVTRQLCELDAIVRMLSQYSRNSTEYTTPPPTGAVGTAPLEHCGAPHRESGTSHRPLGGHPVAVRKLDFERRGMSSRCLCRYYFEYLHNFCLDPSPPHVALPSAVPAERRNVAVPPMAPAERRNAGGAPAIAIEDRICCGITKEGKRCRARAKAGLIFCRWHVGQAPQPSSEQHNAGGASAIPTGGRICCGITAKGKRCRAHAKTGFMFCHWHVDQAQNPSSEQRSVAQ